jgi:hypothetical protein
MRLITVLAVSLTALCLVTGAAATPPSSEILVRSGSFTIDCGAFSLVETFTVEERDTLFFAADGTPERAALHFDYEGVITQSASGETFRDPGHFTIGIDFAGTPLDPSDDTIAIVGEVFQIVAPARGTILQDTGRLLALPAAIADAITIQQLDPGSFSGVYGRLRDAVRTVVAAGPHEAFFADDVEAVLCAALRGERSKR